ncbi:hypothetical protein BDR26DRAFT_650272 [Obelidium mucronatum]|nr:hypothetical protein BDR26DRAFT_650272 [Obelidium mucronatum]
MRNVWPLFAMHRPTSASPNARIIPLYHRPVVQSTMRLSPFSTGGNNHSWAQIGRATEIIKSDLGDGFFELHGPGGATGIMAYFDDASLEIVRCRNVVGSGPLKKADLDDEYAGQAEMDDGIESTFGAKKRGVWRRRQSSFEQEEDGESVKLVVRWMFEGTPRHKLLYAKLLSPLTPPQPVVYEGVFVYRFDNDTGLVINHSLESMSPTPWIPAVCKWWLERKSRRAAKKEAMEGGGSGSGGTSGGGDGGGNGLPQLNSHPGHGLVCEEQKVLESTKKPMSF